MASLRSKLLAWYGRHRRDLPWRHRRDAYSIWISEIMLQQTRVDTVIPYYDRFLDRWPSVQALADADPEAVKAAWSGLGYYRRAKLMLDAAKRIVEDHEGELPSDVESLMRLPGFGRYTAGAVASIAFDRPAPAVDGNTGRVLARIFGIEGDITKGEPQRRVWAEAELLADGPSAGDLTQALIELGALVCSPKSPKCLLCPAKAVCEARRTGSIEEIPPTKKRASRSRIDLTGLLVLDAKHRIVLEQRPETGLLAGLWCLPLLDGHAEEREIVEAARKRWTWKLEAPVTVTEIKHVLTHRDLHMRVIRVRSRGRLPKTLRWVELAGLDRLGIPTVTARALEKSLPANARSEAAIPSRRRPPR